MIVSDTKLRLRKCPLCCSDNIKVHTSKHLWGGLELADTIICLDCGLRMDRDCELVDPCDDVLIKQWNG